MYVGNFLCFAIMQLEIQFYPDATCFLGPPHFHCGFAQGRVSDELSFSVFPPIIFYVLLLFQFALAFPPS